MRFPETSSAAFFASICLLVFATLGAELFLLRHLHRKLAESTEQNNISQEANARRQAEVLGLKMSQSRVKALYVRLRDAIYIRPGNITRGVANNRFRLLDQDETPGLSKSLLEAGIVARPDRVPAGENALIYEAGSSKLELQRLIPLLAEQENSNAFLFLDRVVLNRPVNVPDFSSDPTYLDARFTIRLLTSR